MKMFKTVARRLMGSAFVLLLGATATIADDVTIRVSTALPPTDFLVKSLEGFKAEVENAKVGIKVEVYPGSTLFKQGTEVPAMQRGNLEMSTMTTFEVAQQIPPLGYFNRAYLLRNYAHLRKVFDGPIGAEYRKTVAAKMGIEILCFAYLGTRQINLRQKRIVNSPSDLAGIKMRMPGGPEWLLLGRSLGVSPVPLGAAEIYLALKTGTIDGQDNPLSILNAAKFYEVTEQVVLTSHMVLPVFINVAKPFWDKLTPEQRKAVETAVKSAQKLNDESRLDDEKNVIEALKAKGLEIDTVDLAPFRAYADKIYAEAAATQAWDAAALKRVLDTK